MEIVPVLVDEGRQEGLGMYLLMLSKSSGLLELRFDSWSARVTQDLEYINPFCFSVSKTATPEIGFSRTSQNSRGRRRRKCLLEVSEGERRWDP